MSAAIELEQVPQQIHTISLFVNNAPGVLVRVALVFSRRGFNIDSLAVGVTEDPTLSRITIVVSAEETPLEQITKQLHKLVNVVKIQDLDPSESIDRELILFKVNAPPDRRHEVIEIANVFRTVARDGAQHLATALAVALFVFHLDELAYG